MNIDYTWNIVSLETIPVVGDMAKVIKNIHWRFKGTVDDAETEMYGCLTLNTPENAQGFIPYENLNQSDIVTILTDKLDVEDMKTKMEAVLAEKIKPSLETTTLPWK